MKSNNYYSYYLFLSLMLSGIIYSQSIQLDHLPNHSTFYEYKANSCELRDRHYRVRIKLLEKPIMGEETKESMGKPFEQDYLRTNFTLQKVSGEICVIDSSIKVYSDGSTYRHTYTYDEKGNKISDIDERWDGSQLVNYSRSFYGYDTNGNKISDTYERWDGSQWVKYGRDTYSYNENGNWTSNLFESWDGSQWVNSWLGIQDYDENGNTILFLNENWNGNQWINAWRDTERYDENGNRTSGLSEIWVENQWVNFQRYSIEYVENLTIVLSERWKESQWVIERRATYGYDENGNSIFDLYESWDGSHWGNSQRSSYNRDENGNLISFLSERWNGRQWANIERGTSVYDENGNRTSYLVQRWEGGQWVNDVEFITTYYYRNITDINNINSIYNFELSQNYPNPFNPSTKISYTLKEPAHVSIIVYDVLGKEIATLVKEDKSVGNYSIDFDGSNLSSGIYFYQMKVNDFIEIKKMVLLR